MNSFKKIALFASVFAVIFFMLYKSFAKEKETVPNPEAHIREVFDLLKNNNEDYYNKLILSKGLMDGMKEEYVDEIFSGMPGLSGNIELGKIARQLSLDHHKEFWEQFQETHRDQFEDAHRKLKRLKGFKIEKLTWKLSSNSELSNLYRCNAKIYVRTNQGYYCIKYKNGIYYQGKWYAGIFTDIDEIDEDDSDYFPDMYQAPSNSDYIDKSEELIPVESSEEAIELEPANEDSPKMEED